MLIGSRSQTYRFPSRRNWPWPRGRCNLAFSLGAAARTLLSRWSFNRVTAPSNRARWRRTMKNMWETPIMERKEGRRILRFEFSSREDRDLGVKNRLRKTMFPNMVRYDSKRVQCVYFGLDSNIFFFFSLKINTYIYIFIIKISNLQVQLHKKIQEFVSFTSYPLKLYRRFTYIVLFISK